VMNAKRLGYATQFNSMSREEVNTIKATPIEQGTSMSSDCKKCMSNLLSTLHSIKSKPKALFQSMGVDVSSYVQNSTGVLVRIPQPTSIVQTSNPDNTRLSLKEEEGFGGAPIVSKTNNSEVPNHSNSSNNNDSMMRKLKKRFTQTLQKMPSTSSQPLPVATSAITKPGIELQITCKKCGNDGPEGGARAYEKGPYPLSIVLCSNRLSRKEEIDEVLVHELMHVYDVHYRNWDLTNCYTLAKSEVRAAREAECADASLSFTKRYCAKEKARVATKNMFPDLGNKCVAAVFEEAMADKAPFFDKERSQSDENTAGRSFQSTYPSDSRTSSNRS
jgi:hypothetical protein